MKKIIALVLTISLCMSANKGLDFLYHHKLGQIIRSSLTGPLVSKTAGWYADSSLSCRHIKPFIALHHINMDEAVESNPDNFSSFNDFFIRKLKPETRPIDQSSNSVCSPADGQLLILPNYHSNQTFTVKNVPFNLEKFFNNKEFADSFEGGTIVIIYLAPYDYHRFHFPFDCWASLPLRINGKYESVHPIAYEAGIQPLTENERILINFITQSKQVAFVAVGALCVGRITMTYDSAANNHIKGTELGYFSFGGSTIVMAFAKDHFQPSLEFLNNCFNSIKMGQKIGMLL